MPPNTSILASSQEERLQRVEGTLQDVVSQNSEHSVKLDYLSKTVESQGEVVLKKLDIIVQDLHGFKNSVERDIKRIENRLTPLEASEKARVQRSKSLRKALWIVLGASLGVLGATLGKKLVEVLFG